MPICIECGEGRKEITKIENGVRVLSQCSSCSSVCDTFSELDSVQTSIALMLLHKNAYRHVLFNVPNLLKPLLILVVLSCALEAYVGVVQTSYLGFYREHHWLLRGAGLGGRSFDGQPLTPQTPVTLKDTAQMLLSQAVAQSGTIATCGVAGVGSVGSSTTSGGGSSSAAQQGSSVTSSAYLEKAAAGYAAQQQQNLATSFSIDSDSGDEDSGITAAAGMASPLGHAGESATGGGCVASTASVSTSPEEGAPHQPDSVSTTTTSVFPPQDLDSANRTLYFVQRFLSRRPSLQLVEVVRQYQDMRIVPFFTALPKIFALELLEFAFLLAVLCWVGSALISRSNYPSIAHTLPLGEHTAAATSPTADANGKKGASSSASTASTASTYPESLRVLLRALALSTTSKMGYLLFLIWDMPLYLVLLVEGYQFVILFAALRGAKASFKASVCATFMCLLAKYFFRLLMKSLPPFLASVSFQIMLMRS